MKIECTSNSNPLVPEDSIPFHLWSGVLVLPCTALCCSACAPKRYIGDVFQGPRYTQKILLFNFIFQDLFCLLYALLRVGRL